MSGSSWRTAAGRHYERFWTGRAHEDFAWTLGPALERIPLLRVRRLRPDKSAEPWIYATVGASEYASGGARREFILLSPHESPRHVETLAMVAHHHAGGPRGLDIGDVVDIGHPWLEGATADRLMVSLPYPFGPALEHFDHDGSAGRVLWLVPITAAEAEVALAQGHEALEDLLERSEVDIMSPDRRSVV